MRPWIPTRPSGTPTFKTGTVRFRSSHGGAHPSFFCQGILVKNRYCSNEAKLKVVYMYNQFFGFKEKPFKLVPNPEYLYLSRIHEEVLAHLNYAASFGEGFVEITGEVGTGKTTLCRMFLESLDERTEAAYIFNNFGNHIY